MKLFLIKTLPIVLLTFLLSGVTQAVDSAKPWHNKSAAVVLTYDDTLNVHLDKVIPALDQRGFKGTFYLTINTSKFWNRKNEWARIAENGHELGNHTLFHPCAGNRDGREWVSPDYDLSKYSVQRMVAEVALTNEILTTVDGKAERTFAYPCGDTNAGGISFIEEIQPMFAAARGVANSFSAIDNTNLANVNAFYAYNHSGKQLIELAQQAIKNKTMVVYLFHGVGGEHDSNVSEQAHTELLNYLQQHQQDIWVATMLDAAKCVKAIDE